jgi:hypothetical protein
MHQSFENKNKIFAVGDVVELDNGMPEFEILVGLGVVVFIGPDDKQEMAANEVIVHWQNNVWASGRQQKMSVFEIRHATLL